MTGEDVLFWSRAERLESGCLEWRGAVLPDGYGVVTRRRVRKTSLKAHRYAYEITSGPIPAGMCVCHRCDNRRCIEPGHLFLGTHAENSADAVQKNRVAYGVRQHSVKLTVDDVREIRALYLDGLSKRALSLRFGVVRDTIRKVLDGRTWARVV